MQVAWTGIAIAITAKYKQYAWKQTITQHLGAITKSEIDKRDETIAKLNFELEGTKKHLKGMREKVQTMAGLAAKQVDVAGNTYGGSRDV